MTGQRRWPASRPGSDREAGRRRGRRSLAPVAALVAMAATAAILPAVPAAAGTTGTAAAVGGAVGRPGPVGNGRFGLTPVPGRNGRAASYFMLTVPAGHSVTDTAIISNLSLATEMLKVSRSTGVTAANGGSAFSHSFHRCSGTGCWVTGLPQRITLPAGTGEKLRFTVSVPHRAAAGQYLAGITAELAVPLPPRNVGSNGKATARAIVIEQVTVGVAVTVGSGTGLRTRLRIKGVTGTAIGKIARLSITLDNTGQTFAHAAGQATCRVSGRPRSFHVVADTILTHDHAVIPVNFPGLPEGATVPCTVRLEYGNGRSARWAGMVTVPAPAHTRIYHTGPGDYTVVPAGGIPTWAIVLFVLGALVLAAVALLLFRMRRRGPAG
jgi:hypothetical protein